MSEIIAFAALCSSKTVITDKTEDAFIRFDISFANGGSILRKACGKTIETSVTHIDFLRSLKVLNTSFTTIAYPLLRKHGVLLKGSLSKD